MVLEGEFWSISAGKGKIRSISEGDMFVPQQGWQYIKLNCSTISDKSKKLR